jgi:histone-binding protein RBBP4
MNLYSDLIPLSWDKRNLNAPSCQVEAHEAELLSVAFSPASEFLIVTGSSDKVSTMDKQFPKSEYSFRPAHSGIFGT